MVEQRRRFSPQFWAEAGQMLIETGKLIAGESQRPVEGSAAGTRRVR